VLRARRVASAITLPLLFLSACARHHSVSDCDNPPFPQIMGTNAVLPSTLPPSDSGALVIGTVDDSATRNAVKDAIVLFYSSGLVRDTTAAYTDSTGAFAVRLRGRGPHAYSVGSVGFSRARGSIDISHAAETLRVTIHHGPWLCDVRVTSR